MLTRALGAISGTSMDGIDLAIVETDGHERVMFGPAATLPYPAALKAELLAFLAADPSLAERDPLAALDEAVTDAFGDAIATFLSDNVLTLGGDDLIGLHGQTVWHRPERRFTRQLGLGRRLAARFGVNVVDAFRQADVAAGGQGAPLAPLYHAALAAALPKPLMVLNWGGVGNVTYLGADGAVLAFDTGPASALIDDTVRKAFGLPYDEGGRIAASGRVEEGLLAALMDHPFFDAPPPKSLDRQEFHRRAAMLEGLAPEDAVATLTAFTIAATAAALRHVPAPPRRWLVTGGGRLNGSLMAGLARAVGAPVEPVEGVGWNGDALEAQCFGYLAVRALAGLAISLPTTTGAPEPLTGGQLWRPGSDQPVRLSLGSRLQPRKL
jgi:anhydro-N-acetylmuramic acid kinase